MSTMRSRITGRPGSGRSSTGSFNVFRLVMQASPFRPLMFIASEPQTPSRHDRRKASVSSVAIAMLCWTPASRLSKAIVKACAAMALSGALAACSGPGSAPKQDQGLVAGAIAGGVLGSQIGRGKGSVVGTVLGAVVGGIVGSEIGRSLDDRDRRLAQRAEMDALEQGRSGQRYEWRNPDNGRYGYVVPEASYRRGDTDCRPYTHTVYIDGRPRAMRGTACRNPDGTWSNVG